MLKAIRFQHISATMPMPRGDYSLYAIENHPGIWRRVEPLGTYPGIEAVTAIVDGEVCRFVQDIQSQTEFTDLINWASKTQEETERYSRVLYDFINADLSDEIPF